MIAVTILEAGLEAARRRLAGLGPGAGMVELRLDALADSPWQQLLRASPLPVLVTCRPRSLNGGFDGSEESRLSLLRAALAAGAARIDVELGTPAAAALLQEAPAQRLILSHHEHHAGTAGLEGSLARLLSSPAAVTIKLAFTARRGSDALHARRLLRLCAGEGRPAVILPMGEVGVPGRLLAPCWGAAWTYAAADGAPPAAPGQLPLSQVAGLYDVDGIGSHTVLTGILGWPVTGSLSPWMHNRALRALGLDARYLPFPEDDAADVVMNAGAWGLRGLSVTHPHKQQVLPWLQRTTEAARACGAVNTLTLDGDRLQGDNTDAAAARLAMEAVLPEGWSWRGRRVAIVGAGGAARAAAWELGCHGARVCLYSRDAERGEAAAAGCGAESRPLARLSDEPHDVLVHATPVGMWPGVEEAAIPQEALGGELVFDMVSNPRRTRLLREAAALGLRVQEGVAMLAIQGEAQFARWHGQAPPAGSFVAAALQGLAAGTP